MEDGILPDDTYSGTQYETNNQKKRSHVKNGRSVPNEGSRAFQVHDNEIYFNHIFSLQPQRISNQNFL